MKAILLCAGYATRLYPLTLDKPKPLLPVGGKAIIEYILDKLRDVKGLDTVYIVTNAKFKDSFIKWQKEFRYHVPVKVLNDDSTCNDNRIGAIGDMQLVIDQEKIDDDTVVIAGDNIFSFSVSEFVEEALKKRPEVSIALFDVENRELAKKYGIVKTNPDKSLVLFLEKPADPPSTLASIGLYFFPKENLSLIKKYLSKNLNPDAPGYYIKWLSETTKVYTHTFRGEWLDIGDMNSYKEADKIFSQKHKKGS